MSENLNVEGYTVLKLDFSENQDYRSTRRSMNFVDWGLRLKINRGIHPKYLDGELLRLKRLSVERWMVQEGNKT